MHVAKYALPWVIGLLACNDKKPEAAPVPSASASASVSASPASASADPSAAAPTAAGDVQTITAQHILIAYKGAKAAQGSILRSKEDARKRAADIDAKAKAGDDFSALAQQFSDDLGSRDRQGNLGKFGRDKMVKPFADAAFALPVGAVSDVVESPFGFHIIKRNQ